MINMNKSTEAILKKEENLFVWCWKPCMEIIEYNPHQIL